uniref:Uncharacterized protein n=1 Tax=Anguilla anguilla TaxID=7936 RepID=A0A0E9QAC6_ANGAN
MNVTRITLFTVFEIMKIRVGFHSSFQSQWVIVTNFMFCLCSVSDHQR